MAPGLRGVCLGEESRAPSFPWTTLLKHASLLFFQIFFCPGLRHTEVKLTVINYSVVLKKHCKIISIIQKVSNIHNNIVFKHTPPQPIVCCSIVKQYTHVHSMNKTDCWKVPFTIFIHPVCLLCWHLLQISFNFLSNSSSNSKAVEFSLHRFQNIYNVYIFMNPLNQI